MPDGQPRFADPKDSPHVLPLRAIPLETQSLKDAKLTKNARLESVIELFSDAQTGSGQIFTTQLEEFFDFSGSRQKDLEVVQALGELPSYDVYSLRAELRNLDIDVGESDDLRLSKEMESTVSSYMRSYIRPLICAIYGEEKTNGQSLEDVVRLMQDPDVETAQNNLRALADKLEMGLLAIPDFLARYGDVYLSLAYYNYCLDQIRPALIKLQEAFEEIRRNHKNRSDQALIKGCALIEDRLTGAETSTSRLLEVFRVETENMWKKVSSTRFKAMETMIQGYHKEIGGSVCALTVKVNCWELFMGEPRSRTTESFLMSEMLTGIERVPRGYISGSSLSLSPES